MSARLRDKVMAGAVSIRSAAYILFDLGWFDHVPTDREVINHLHIII